jgi:hypothetical protein
VERAFHALLARLTIDHDGDPDPKTPKVLKSFAEADRGGAQLDGARPCSLR